MPKVVNNTCELQIPFPATTVQQTLTQINILTSPTLIEFIITVYLDKILTEEGHVTAQCSRTLSTVSRSQEASQPYTMDCILRLAFNSFRPDMNRAYHTRFPLSALCPSLPFHLSRKCHGRLHGDGRLSALDAGTHHRLSL